MTTLEALAGDLAPHFKPGFLQRPLTVFQFTFDEDPPFFLEVEESTFRFCDGTSSDATLTLSIRDHALCRRLLIGQADGMEAFMSGAYRADGNIVLSQLILYLFKPADPTLIYEVKD